MTGRKDFYHMDGVNENVIEWLRGDKVAAVTAPGNSKLKGMITRLAEKCPDEVEILERNKDGSIFAHVPVEFVTIRKPRQMSDAQMETAKLNFEKAKAKKGVSLPNTSEENKVNSVQNALRV